MLSIEIMLKEWFKIMDFLIYHWKEIAVALSAIFMACVFTYGPESL